MNRARCSTGHRTQSSPITRVLLEKSVRSKDVSYPPNKTNRRSLSGTGFRPSEAPLQAFPAGVLVSGYSRKDRALWTSGRITSPRVDTEFATKLTRSSTFLLRRRRRRRCRSKLLRLGNLVDRGLWRGCRWCGLALKLRCWWGFCSLEPPWRWWNSVSWKRCRSRLRRWWDGCFWWIWSWRGGRVHDWLMMSPMDSKD